MRNLIVLAVLIGVIYQFTVAKEANTCDKNNDGCKKKCKTPPAIDLDIKRVKVFYFLISFSN
jgi:hypothetical protein